MSSPSRVASGDVDLPQQSPGRQSPGRRRLRRAVTVVAGLVVLVTVGSAVANRFTDGRATPPAGLTYLRTVDLTTRVSVHGSSGSPVVLVPGAAESADTWDPVAQRLAVDHRVYAYDVVGWGYTQRRGPYDLDHATRQLLALLDALHLDHPVLVGHSSGAAVVAEAALRAPGRIGGLMLLDGDALATGAGSPTPLRYLVLPPLRTTVLRLAIGSDALIRSVYGRQCGPRCPELDAAGVDVWRRPFQVRGAEAALWQMLDTGVLGVTVERLQQLALLDLPKAVVFGAEDDVFDPGTPQATAARIGAGAPHLIPGARHLSLISDPGVVANAIEELPRIKPS